MRRPKTLNPFRELQLPAADFVVVVSLAHTAELIQIVPQGVAVRSAQVIVVDHVLDVGNGIVQFALVETAAVVPVFGEFMQLLFGVIQPVAVPPR